MSIVNLHKKFVCKIVETGYFAEIPARASVKGRPKKCPPPADRWGIVLAELTRGDAGGIVRYQPRLVGDGFPRHYHTHKEQLVAQCPCLGVVADVEVAHLQMAVRLVLFPTTDGHTLDRIAEELPQEQERIPHHNDDCEHRKPRQSNNPIEDVVEGVVTGFLIPVEQRTKHQPSAENREYDCQLFYHFLSSFGTLIISHFGGFVKSFLTENS